MIKLLDIIIIISLIIVVLSSVKLYAEDWREEYVKMKIQSFKMCDVMIDRLVDNRGYNWVHLEDISNLERG